MYAQPMHLGRCHQSVPHEWFAQLLGKTNRKD